MTRRLSIPGLAILVALLAAPTAARADGGMFAPELFAGDLHEPAQRAVALHVDGKQTLLLFVDYEGGAERMAWVVPTPGRPSLDTADPAIFGEVVDYVEELRMRAWKRWLADARNRGLLNGGGLDVGDGAVVLHESGTVGPYEFAVLSSADGESLASWLSEHGYRIPEDLAPVLQTYADEGWYFAAVQVQLTAGERITLPPLKLDFETPEPVFPLRISAANRGITDVRLYLFRRPEQADPAAYDHEGRTFLVEDDLPRQCPELASALPFVPWEELAVTRVTTQLVPQVMARLDDRLEPSTADRRGSNPGDLVFHRYPCEAWTRGVAEALMAERPAEREWATKALWYYEHIAKEHGRELQGPPEGGLYTVPPLVMAPQQVEWLREEAAEHGPALDEAARAAVVELREGRGGSSRIQGGLELLRWTMDDDLDGYAAFLETEIAGHDPRRNVFTRLGDLGTPASRRSLARLALAGGRWADQAARDYLRSLGASPPDEDERAVLRDETAALLDAGVLDAHMQRQIDEYRRSL